MISSCYYNLVEIKKCEIIGFDYVEYKKISYKYLISFDEYCIIKNNNISEEEYQDIIVGGMTLAESVLRKRYSDKIANLAIKSDVENEVASKPEKYQTEERVVKKVVKNADIRVVTTSVATASAVLSGILLDYISNNHVHPGIIPLILFTMTVAPMMVSITVKSEIMEYLKNNDIEVPTLTKVKK